MKALGPIYLAMFLIGATSFASMEATAMNSGDMTRLLLTLAVLFAAMRAVRLRRPPLAPVDFDEAPAATQRLGLYS
jgi:hypothetical protein